MPDKRPRGYQPAWQPRPNTLELLAAVDVILDRYADHLPISIRQAFYAAVSDGVLAKTERAYKRLVEVVGMGRRSGRIPWEVIRDDSGARAESPIAFADLRAFRDGLRRAAEAYRRDGQEGQPIRLELWSEASGMVPQLASLASPYGVPVYSGGGFNSLPGKHDAALRAAHDPRGLCILHVGDLDPSGTHLHRALAEDVAAFAAAHGGRVELVRVAVTEAQVESHGLPTAPPKATDRRSFTAAGTTQAEALPPDVLTRLVRAAIEERRDAAVHQAVLEQEAVERQQLLSELEN
ncbi:hypothetical protein [Streptomyces malaysiensis]|uniref:hypothetical protein n=1 Tax=Streptomyces malaysiensis TaxID=92644 RepID=UPI0008533491|nr:hypothetical protein [Streptomyces sp. SPMA113]